MKKKYYKEDFLQYQNQFMLIGIPMNSNFHNYVFRDFIITNFIYEDDYVTFLYLNGENKKEAILSHLEAVLTNMDMWDRVLVKSDDKSGLTTVEWESNKVFLINYQDNEIVVPNFKCAFIFIDEYIDDILIAENMKKITDATDYLWMTTLDDENSLYHNETIPNEHKIVTYTDESVESINRLEKSNGIFEENEIKLIKGDFT